MPHTPTRLQSANECSSWSSWRAAVQYFNQDRSDDGWNAEPAVTMTSTRALTTITHTTRALTTITPLLGIFSGEITNALQLSRYNYRVTSFPGVEVHAGYLARLRVSHEEVEGL